MEDKQEERVTFVGKPISVQEFAEMLRRKERIEHLRSFAWETASNEFLEKIIQVLHENGYE